MSGTLYFSSFFCYLFSCASLVSSSSSPQPLSSVQSIFNGVARCDAAQPLGAAFVKKVLLRLRCSSPKNEKNCSTLGNTSVEMFSASPN